MAIIKILLAELSLSFLLLNPAYASNEIDIFIEGCHLNAPIPTPNEWYAIYNGDNTSKLLRAELKVSKKLAGVDDLYNFCVEVNSNAAERTQIKPVILIKGKQFKAGLINTAKLSGVSFKEHQNKTFVGNEMIPETNEVINIGLGIREYALKQKTKLDDNASGNNHTLTLIHNSLEQIIFDKRGNYEGATGFYIIWAGDIDNDQKLDLILNLPETYASPYNLRLYLSSKANNHELLHKVVERGFSSP